MAFDHKQMKLATLNTVFTEQDDQMKNKIKTYLDLKKSNLKPFYESTKLDKQFKHLTEKYNDEEKSKARNIFKDPAYNTAEKVRTLLTALNLQYDFSDAPSVSSRKKLLFELKGDYDLVIIGDATGIYTEILSYFWHMMDL